MGTPYEMRSAAEAARSAIEGLRRAEESRTEAAEALVPAPPACQCGSGTEYSDDCERCQLMREIERLRDEAKEDWSYQSLERILRDELPITMTLGLAATLVDRMVRERMFAERVDGVVAAMESVARRALGEVGDD